MPAELRSQGRHTPFASTRARWNCRAACATRWSRGRSCTSLPGPDHVRGRRRSASAGAVAHARAAAARRWRIVRSVVHLLYGLVLIACSSAPPATRRPASGSSGAGRPRSLRLLGVRLQGAARRGPAPQLIVANHVSWLDIMAIDAVVPARFVSRSRFATGRCSAHRGGDGARCSSSANARARRLRVVHQMAEALQAGDTLAVFPEGTTSDGRARCCRSTPTCCRRRSPRRRRCSRSRCAFPTRRMPSARPWSSSAQRRCCRACGRLSAPRACACIVDRVLPAQAVDHADRRGFAERLRDEIAAAIAALAALFLVRDGGRRLGTPPCVAQVAARDRLELASRVVDQGMPLGCSGRRCRRRRCGRGTLTSARAHAVAVRRDDDALRRCGIVGAELLVPERQHAGHGVPSGTRSAAPVPGEIPVAPVAALTARVAGVQRRRRCRSWRQTSTCSSPYWRPSPPCSALQCP